MRRSIIVDIFTPVEVFFSGNPFLVILTISLMGNMIPFFPIPYLLFVVGLSQAYPTISIVQIAAVSALGAATGKFVSYVLGYEARRALTGSQARFDSFRKLLGGSAFLVAFMFAASPFPDDIVMIPLGIIRYSAWKTYIALYAGKFVLAVFVVFAAKTSQTVLNDILGGGILVSVISIVFVVVFTFLLMRVDWDKRLSQGHESGLLSRARRRLARLVHRQ